MASSTLATTMVSLHRSGGRRIMDAVPLFERLRSTLSPRHGELLDEFVRKDMVTAGWPGNLLETSPLPDFRNEFGTRVCWWATPVPRHMRTTSMVCSRLGRKLDTKAELFRVLRIACSQLDPCRQMMMTVAGTTLHPFLVRAAELFGIPILEVVIPKPNVSVETWLDQCVSRDAPASPSYWQCYLSPLLNVDPTGSSRIPANPVATSRTSPPLRDQILVHAADQVLALHVRVGGNLQHALQQRLRRSTSSPRPSVFLALGSSNLVASSVGDELMRLGGIGWLLRSAPTDTGTDATYTAVSSPQTREVSASIVPLPVGPWRWLTHCTRRADGPWPDQSRQDYLDELMLGELARDRSSLAALMRIVVMRRLLATGTAIRQKNCVVSFTAADFDELGTMRMFQPHRGRWDFEPYGICIDRNYLRTRGTRPVHYGDDQLWESLEERERPFFQLSGTEQQRATNWRREQEWRHLGDLDLHSLSPEQGLVFVPSESEARQVACVSPWPVTIVNW